MEYSYLLPLWKYVATLSVSPKKSEDKGSGMEVDLATLEIQV